MQRVIGADLHALAATNASGEKLGFIQRTRRTQQSLMAALAHARCWRASAEPRPPRRRARSSSCAGPDPALPLPSHLRKKRNCKAVVRTAPTQFMHIRHSALRHGTPPIGSSPPWQCNRQRLQLSQLAGILVQPENRPARNHAEQRAQRADRPAPQPRDAQAGRRGSARNKIPSTRPCAKCAWRKSSTVACRARASVPPVVLMRAMWLCSSGASTARTRKVERRQKRKSNGTDQQAERIKPTDHHRAEERGHQPRDQHHILDRLPALIAIRLDALLAAFRLRWHVADKMLQRAHGADPAAEESPQKQRGTTITRLHSSPR